MRKASLFTIFLIVFIDLVGFGILLPNQQYYGETLGISNPFFLTLIGPAYSFFQFLFAPILGAWSDRVGRRPVLIASQVGTLVGFLLLFSCHFVVGASPALAIFLLYFSRVLDGISGGNISIASAYIADITEAKDRAKGMGIIGAAFGIGFVFGPAIGGLVGKHLGLAWVPVVAALFSAAALLMTIFTLPESHHPGEPTEGARRFSFGGLRRALERRTIGAMIMMSFVNGFAFAGMEQTFSLLIQDRGNLTPQDASGASGYLFGGIGIIIVLVQGGMIGRLTKRFGEPALAATGPALIAVGLLIVGMAGRMWGVWPDLIVGSGLLALGSSLFNPSIQSLISRHAAQHEQGEILGASQGMASLARAAGPMLAGYLYWKLSSGAPYYVAAGICGLVAVWALGMGQRLRPPAAPEGGTYAFEVVKDPPAE
jgi:MFS family permease